MNLKTLTLSTPCTFGPFHDPPHHPPPSAPHNRPSMSETFSRLLRQSVHRRVATSPTATITLFFSGGLDSSVLALLTAFELSKLHSRSELCLKTIQFREGSPDRVSALLSYKEVSEAKRFRAFRRSPSRVAWGFQGDATLFLTVTSTNPTSSFACRSVADFKAKAGERDG